MCGIFGYKGKRQDAPQIVLDGLKALEYRGYDSWGLARKQDHKIIVEKEVGRIPSSGTLSVASMAIGHTRWATHGGVTRLNAHPHTSSKDTIAVVHNGIIENYEELKKKFKLETISDTDSEIIPHLIDYFYEREESFVKASILTLREVKGSFAVVVMHEADGKIIAARKDSPLVIGLGKDEFLISSDIPALLSHTRNVVHLLDNQVAVINHNINIIDLHSGKKAPLVSTSIEWDVQTAQKEGFEHFMLKEIHEQPAALMKALQGRIKNSLPNIKELAGQTKDIDRFIIVACGTSWHAGLVGEFLLEGLANLPVEVEYASEFRYSDPIIDKRTAVLAISQSGETADTLAAIREAKRKGARVWSICNVMESTIARESDVVLYTRAGPEIGVASTKAFTTQVTMLYLLTAHFAQQQKTLTTKQIKDMISDIASLPALIENVSNKQDEILAVAKLLATKSNALYLGRGVHFPIALEGALKLKEVSYIHAEGYPAAEMKHGPIALIDKDMPTIVIATKDSLTYEKIISNMQEVKARGGELIAIATRGDIKIKQITPRVIYIPKTRYSLSSLLAVIPLQLLAYQVAVLRGCDVDKPRNLAKSVTVE